ncbi:MAG TPA: glycosyltransferase [Spongiibacteraceae bacterium]|nr:glycosyltransferase [Spongiibacteraceae bacterium]
MAEKTILHVIDSTEPGGAETVFVQLADELRHHGYRSIVVVSGEGWVTEELRRRNLEPRIIDAKGAFNLALVRGLLKIVREEQVDLIQSHLLGSNVYCALVGLIARRPVVATFHGMVDVSPDERLRWLKFQIMNAGVSRFVAVSQRLSDAIQREGLLNPRKTTIIYNGVDFSRYGRTASTDLRDRLSLDESCILIGSLGNLHPAKGYDDLIKAARLVVDAHPEVHFVIAGDIKPHLIGDLEALMKELSVEANVHFIGFVDDSAAFLGQLDMFLLTSTSEGFSIATVEAMATGLPCVVTRCGGPEEIVTDNVDALMVDPAEPTAIVEGVMRALALPDRGLGLSKCARESVFKRFSLDEMFARYTELYTALF